MDDRVRQLVRSAVPATVPEPDYDRLIAEGRRRRSLRRAGYAVTAATIILLLTLGTVLARSEQVRFAPAGPTESEPTVEWSRFTDETSGISLRHPADWKVLGPPVARGVGHVVTIASPDVNRAPIEGRCENDPSAGWPTDGAVIRVYDHGVLPLDLPSTRPERLLLDDASRVSPCNFHLHAWQFGFDQHARSVTVLVYVGRQAPSGLFAQAQAVTDSVVVEDRRPVSDADRTAYHLGRTQDHMAQSLGIDGLQAWQWALDELEAAIDAADRAGLDELVGALRALHHDSAAVLNAQARMIECRDLMAQGREEGPAEHDQCYLDVTANQQARRDLYHRLEDEFGHHTRPHSSTGHDP